LILIQAFVFLLVESFQAVNDTHTSPGIAPYPISPSTSNFDQDMRAEIFAMRDKIVVLVDKCDRLHTRYGTLENWVTWKLDELSDDINKLSNSFLEHREAVTVQMVKQQAMWDEQRKALQNIIVKLQDSQPPPPPTQMATDIRDEYFAQELDREKIEPSFASFIATQRNGKDLAVQDGRVAGVTGLEVCAMGSGLGSAVEDTASGSLVQNQGSDADIVSAKTGKEPTSSTSGNAPAE
jgi:hypothetical protein